MKHHSDRFTSSKNNVKSAMNTKLYLGTIAEVPLPLTFLAWVLVALLALYPHNPVPVISCEGIRMAGRPPRVYATETV